VQRKEENRLTLEEVLDLLRLVDVTLPADPLDLPELTGPGGGDDVLVVDLGVLGEVDDGAEIVVESLERSVVLEELDELKRSEEVRVLGGDLDNNLKVLSDVGSEHLLEAGERLLDGKGSKVGDEPFRVEEVGVNDDSLDVAEVLVVLESLSKLGGQRDQLNLSQGETVERGIPTYLLQQTGLLAEVGDPGSVVVGEHLVGENSLGDLRSVDKVHLEQSGLQGSVLRLVLLERVEEERGRLLDHVRAHKDVDNLRIEGKRRVRGQLGKAAGERGVDNEPSRCRPRVQPRH
jgi:hypothetical protein